MYKLAFAFVSLFFVLGAPASGSAIQDKWVVTQLSGDARLVHPGLQPASVHVQSELAPGDTLLTGPTGRATLVRGADYIVVAPHSELRLPATPQPTGFTRVIQDMGTLLFKVQHTGIPHFAVDTPMLAAVVKGTTFTVVVDQQRSAVQVIQGVVQVSAVEGGMSRMVEGGRTVFIDRVMPKVLFDADKPVPAINAPSSASVKVSAAGDTPLATIASLTGGLVRADLTAPQTTVASNVATPLPVVQTAQTGAQPTLGSGGSATGPTATTPATNPSVATPGTSVVGGTPAPATTPAVTIPSVTVPATTTPTVTTPSVTVPAITPTVTVPSVTVPAITAPTVTVPSVTVPAITTPTVTVPSVTVPAITTPTVTVPTVSTPTLTVPSLTIPGVPVSTPTITVPSISTPSVSVAPPPPPPLLKL